MTGADMMGMKRLTGSLAAWGLTIVTAALPVLAPVDTREGRFAQLRVAQSGSGDRALHY